MSEPIATSPLGGCGWYAQQMGWKLLRGNVMVEGNTDVRYFRHAAIIYEKKTGLSLLGRDLSIFAAGSGDAGGTFGIMENFPVLFSMAKLDQDSNGKIKYRTIALLDNDNKGRSAAKGIIAGNRSIHKNAHVFLLQRFMPINLLDAAQITSKAEELNLPYKGIDCVIEDVLDGTLCNLYAETNPQHVVSTPEFRDDGHHWRWTEDGKFGLVKFVEENAELNEMTGVIETLKSLRFYLKLPTEGISL
jgi:hypothetical protein